MKRRYRLKGNSPYFKEKYGDANPTVEVEGTDEAVLGESWMDSQRPVAYLYAVRVAQEHLPKTGDVYYVKVGGRAAELVHETELGEELGDDFAKLPEPSPTLEPVGATA